MSLLFHLPATGFYPCSAISLKNTDRMVPIIDICMEMQGYITNKDVVSTVISDRLTAITNAIYDARAHADRFNILLIIGKGNERWIKDHRKHVPFDGDDHVVERMFGL